MPQGFELSIACLTNILNTPKPNPKLSAYEKFNSFDMFSTFALKEEGGQLLPIRFSQRRTIFWSLLYFVSKDI